MKNLLIFLSRRISEDHLRLIAHRLRSNLFSINHADQQITAIRYHPADRRTHGAQFWRKPGCQRDIVHADDLNLLRHLYAEHDKRIERAQSHQVVVNKQVDLSVYKAVGMVADYLTG